jgi:flagellar protein FliS
MMNTDPRVAYRQAAGQNANPVHLIVLLYEQLVEDLRRAAAAIDQRDAEGRTNHLSHAMEVLGELEASLDMKAGQEVARNLAHFYEVLRSGLLQVQFHPDRRVVERYISNLISMREAWVEVQRQGEIANNVSKEVAGPEARKAQAVSDLEGGQTTGRDWKV